MDVKEAIVKPVNDYQFTVYVILLSCIIAWMIWLKFGFKQSKTKLNKEIKNIIDSELDKILIKVPIGGKSSDPSDTTKFRVKTETGMQAIIGTIERIEKHYDDNFRKLEESTLPMLYEQVRSLTQIVIELKTALKIYTDYK